MAFAVNPSPFRREARGGLGGAARTHGILKPLLIPAFSSERRRSFRQRGPYWVSLPIFTSLTHLVINALRISDAPYLSMS